MPDGPPLPEGDDRVAVNGFALLIHGIGCLFTGVQDLESASLSVPVCRAAAFRHIMANKTVCINEGELIVGERGPSPKATPTYP
ncbi:MAG: hypothetical protein KKD59_09180, partial [Acidobacteria bacterium]|nr:hypothetical protein [Acidobacteriota bacterium]